MHHAQDHKKSQVLVASAARPHPSAAQLTTRNSTAGGVAARDECSIHSANKAATHASDQHGRSAGAAAGRGATSRTAWQCLLASLASACWIACSSGAVIVNKHIMVDLNFPYPCTVAALGIIGTSIISRLLLQAMQLRKGPKNAPAAVSWHFYFSCIAPAGLFLAMSMLLGNTAYLHLSVAYIQMLKAFTPVITMLAAFLFKLERPSLALITAIALITTGVAAASWGEGALNIAGCTAMAGSLMCEALRLVLTQMLLSRQALSPVQTLAYVTSAAALWMLLAALLTEALAIHQHGVLSDIASHQHALLASAVAGFGANAMAMLVISLSGALALKCLGLAKDAGLVCFGVVVLGEHVSATQGFGYGISLLGFLLYNLLRLRSSRAGDGIGDSKAGRRVKAAKGGKNGGSVWVDVFAGGPAPSQPAIKAAPTTAAAAAGATNSRVDRKRIEALASLPGRTKLEMHSSRSARTAAAAVAPLQGLPHGLQPAAAGAVGQPGQGSAATAAPAAAMEAAPAQHQRQELHGSAAAAAATGSQVLPDPQPAPVPHVLTGLSAPFQLHTDRTPRTPPTPGRPHT